MMLCLVEESEFFGRGRYASEAHPDIEPAGHGAIAAGHGRGPRPWQIDGQLSARPAAIGPDRAHLRGQGGARLARRTDRCAVALRAETTAIYQRAFPCAGNSRHTR